MTKPIKPGIDRRVAKAVNDVFRGPLLTDPDLQVAVVAIRAIARELPPTQAARLLKAAGIEKKGRRS